MSSTYIVRHAESEFNVAYVDKERDPKIFDPVLTECGIAQSKRLGEELANLQPDLIVSSPLTRALQTAHVASNGRWPIVAMAGLREKQFNSCDVGTPKSELAARFPSVNLSMIDEIWWYAGDHREFPVSREPVSTFLDRVADFRTHLIQQITEGSARVVYFGHQTFFESLVGQTLGNCQMMALDQVEALFDMPAIKGV